MKPILPVFIIVFSLALLSCGASKELSAEVAASKSALEKCQDQLSSVQQQLTQARAQLGGNNNELSQVQAENQSLNQQLSNMQAQLASVTQQMQASSDDYGVWFRVQIGAYGQRKVDNKLQTTDQLSLENTDDLQKTALGRFRVYDDAKMLKDHLVGIGLKDAWIVSYKDGARVPIESVKN